MESVTDASVMVKYDLRLIPAEQVESIEIMKSSKVHGSGAAGVINITLKKAGRKQLQERPT
jgi:vitamin B12 transporter